MIYTRKVIKEKKKRKGISWVKDNPFKCNRRFNFFFRRMNESDNEDEWDYWAREIDSLIIKIKKR